MKLIVKPTHQSLNWIAKEQPIVPAKTAPPAWWKTVKHNSNMESLAGAGNIKTCPAIRDIINYGYIMPAWSWIEITHTDEGTQWQMGGGPNPGVEGHSQSQVEGSPVTPLEYGGVFKLVSAWQFNTPPGWAVIFNDPFWHFDDRPVRFLPGLVRTDAYNQVNFPFEINKPMEIGERIQIVEGTPLVHISIVPVDELDLDVSFATEKDEALYTGEAQAVNATHRHYYDKAVKKFDNDRST